MSLFGILNVNKPAGCTSRDVVDKIERLSLPAKAGHAGTLDPLATGVLVICVGQATRLIQYIQRMPKHYRATFVLGRRSETDDIEGNVVEIAGAPIPSRAMLDRALPQFVGAIQQRPPAHSAVKVRGKRAYQLARSGKTMDLAPRTVTIHSLVVRRYDYPELELEIECGSGTYVRALGRDLAEALGTGTVMSSLERTAIGGFRAQNAVSVEELNPETLPRYLQSALAAVADLPRCVLTDAQLSEIRHGRPIKLSTRGAPEISRPDSKSDVAAIDATGELVAIVYQKRAGELWPAHNFLP
jgi:tRNA pseudouridine55 synthase